MISRPSSSAQLGVSTFTSMLIIIAGMTGCDKQSSGRVTRSSEIPYLGNLLPTNLKLTDIQYHSYEATGEVLMRAKAGEEEFDRIVAHWNADAVKYKEGFKYTGSVPSGIFRPPNGHVYAATCAVPAASRQSGWVYFEPSADAGEGTLYVHLTR